MLGTGKPSIMRPQNDEDHVLHRQSSMDSEEGEEGELKEPDVDGLKSNGDAAAPISGTADDDNDEGDAALWQALIILDALVVWLIWLRTLPGSRKPPDEPEPEPV